MVLIAAGTAWIAGLVATGAWGAPWWMGALWVAAAGPFAARRRPTLWAACIVLAAVAGARLSSAGEVGSPAWKAAVGTEVTLGGTIVAEQRQGQVTARYELSVDRVEAPAAPFGGGGKVLVYFEQYADYLPGDRLELRGKLEEAETGDDFDFRGYLARKGISAVMYRPRVVDSEPGGASPRRWLTALRLRLDRSLERSLPEPAASLAAGIAFGRDDGLSMGDKEAYNRAGLRHLVAVSGGNVALVTALTYFVAMPLVGRRWAWAPAALTVAAYLGAAGLSASVLRAGVMAGVLLGGTALGRPQAGLPALMAAVIAMTAAQPAIAREPGFQLSAAATAGLIMFSPWLGQWFLRMTNRGLLAFVPEWACQAAALTLAASAATAPILWVTFGQVSLVSPLANAVVEPVFAVAFWLSIATAGAGLASAQAGGLIGVVAYYPLAFIGWSAETFAGVPLAAVDTPRRDLESALAACAALAALGMAAYRFRPTLEEEHREARQRRKAGARFVLAGAAGICGVAAVPTSLMPASAHEGLTVDFLDVGQGDAALVTTRHGQQVLIDGGPSGIELARELGEVMPHWDRSLDLILLTHPQEDHVAGLTTAFRRYSAGGSYATGAGNSTAAFGHYVAAGHAPRLVVRGDTFDLDGAHFEVLWPPADYRPDDLNETSLVVRLTYGEVSFLLTGDIQGEALETLLADEDLAADVLKVPHHGSKTTPARLFEEVVPAVAVISVGAENMFGHPHPLTLEALATTRVYRTDLDGRVSVRTDGVRLKVATER